MQMSSCTSLVKHNSSLFPDLKKGTILWRHTYIRRLDVWRGRHGSKKVKLLHRLQAGKKKEKKRN